VLQAGIALAAGDGGAFGRWQGPARHCRLAIRWSLTAPLQTRECQLVRVDQRQQGVLSIRFMGEAAMGQGQITFAGVLDPPTNGLHCRQERCRLIAPIQLRVSAVGLSDLSLDRPGSRGAAGELQATTAEGQCLIARGRVHCEARPARGGHWRATAELQRDATGHHRRGRNGYETFDSL
jgi:hypothetical protein